MLILLIAKKMINAPSFFCENVGSTVSRFNIRSQASCSMFDEAQFSGQVVWVYVGLSLC